MRLFAKDKYFVRAVDSAPMYSLVNSSQRLDLAVDDVVRA